MLELTEPIKSWVLSTAKDLKGRALRMFMARTVQALGEGGQRRAERELGWNRGTIRKGMHEIESGIACLDAYGMRGRKRSEEHLPNLLTDLCSSCRWSESGRPAVSYQPPLYTLDRS